jgi:hypothetical protein
MSANGQSEFKGRYAILLVGMLPPPVHGQAVATQSVFDSSWSASDDIARINLSGGVALGRLGKFNIGKIIHFIGCLLNAIGFLNRDCRKVIYFTPGIPGFVQLVRDHIFLSLVRFKADRIVIHQHSGGVFEYFERNPLLWKMFGRAFHKPDCLILIAERESRLGELLEAKEVCYIKNVLLE